MISHSPHWPHCCSRFVGLGATVVPRPEPSGVGELRMRNLWHFALVHHPGWSDLPPVLTRRTTGSVLHRGHFAELGKREPRQGGCGVFPEGEVGWEGGPGLERGGTRMKSDRERAAGVGEGKARHPRAASTQLTQVVIVFLLALFRQGSALGICNGDPQHHPEGTRLHLTP